MASIRKGDQVQVIAGKDKGIIGEVLSVDGDRVVVAGANRVTRHKKATQSGEAAGIVVVEAPLHISNVMVVVDDEGTKTTTRLASSFADGKKIRVSRRTGKEV